MPSFVAYLSAVEVDSRLCASLHEQQEAERNAVLWFAEVMNRRLYRELGYASIQIYAGERLQFSRSKTAYFVRLASAIKNLPRLRVALERGELGWSNAALVVQVATPRTEKRWIKAARTMGRRDLSRKVKAARRAAERKPGSGDLFPPAYSTPVPAGAGAAGSSAAATSVGVGSDLVTAEAPVGAGGSTPLDVAAHVESGNPPPVPGPSRDGGGAFSVPGATPEGHGPTPAPRTTPDAGLTPVFPAGFDALPAAATEVRLRLTPEQRASYEAMLEKLRKLGAKGTNADLVLEAMTLFLLDRSTSGKRARAARPADSSNRLDAGNANQDQGLPDSTHRAQGGSSARVHAPIYHVYVRTCETCDRGWMEATAGPKLLDMATLRTILCDARISRSHEANRHAIPPALRRRALERDGYRCRARGCGSHRMLNVHHLQAKEDGGPHRIENLITLCRPCHTLVHALRGGEPALGWARPAPANRTTAGRAM